MIVTLRIETARDFVPLLDPARYKGAYGIAAGQAQPTVALRVFASFGGGQTGTRAGVEDHAAAFKPSFSHR